jgi:dihydrofolate reductase
MKITIYIATSANGFISNGRNVPDWLSEEYGAGMYALCQRYKAVIMGKATYDILTPDYLPLTSEGTTVVLSRNGQAKSTNRTVVFTPSSPAEVVAMLKERGHENAVIIGGALTMSEFINASLVDDIYFVVEPTVFGTGLPMLKASETEVKLKLLEVAKLNDNTVRLHYQVEKA